MAPKIGLFFGSSTGAGERVAGLIKQIVEQIGAAEVDVIVITSEGPKALEGYEYQIWGCSTWNIGELQDDWAIRYPELDSVNLKGKKIAIYGPGDQFGYSNSYADALGILMDKAVQQGAEPMGFWPIDDSYEFEYSRGVVENTFMGLAVDEDNQREKTEQRVVDWVYWVLEDMGLYDPAAVEAAE
ncbi:MAG: flavodoxin [Caldilineaceae bacterium]|nr:flavodoxin [Caldilineaceae bacterium]MCB9138597.1 flavodoxin [Caldilineaceae bacterium]